MIGVIYARYSSDSQREESIEGQLRECYAFAEKQKFNVVIVWKLDRFARNRYDSATYKSKLKKNAVKVISATERSPKMPRVYCLNRCWKVWLNTIPQSLPKRLDAV